MVGPLSMLVIGMLMGPLDLKKAFGNIRVYLAALIRLILFPILSVLLIRYSGLLKIHPMAEQIYMVTMLAAASCSAASIPQMAQVYGKDAESANYSSMLNVVILAFSIVTLPLIIYIYQMII